MIDELQLELSIKCNSNCIMCPRNKLDESRSKGIGNIDIQFAKEIIDNAYKLGTRLLKPQWFGEGTLHKNWQEIIDYAHNKGINIMVVTNGFLLDKNKQEFIVKNNIYKVFFSIDSGDKEQYEHIRKGLKFDIVYNHLKELFELRNISRGKTKIYVVAVDLGFDNRLLYDKFENICDGIIINKKNYIREVGKEKVNVKCLHNADGRLVVGWDGKCYLCCHDWLGKYYIGDLNKQSIEEVWCGKERTFYINNLGTLDICKKCISE